ncbi:hypothetical protein GLOIN_2v1764926 [Rhizophagus clarus]|uniref:Uncharacterized protein n=1 Tax=Rhizophagus clarus TaxID=94130 RepID=A0A8H3LUB7_9GLOM|nr:hypothetical protein GLOIN_2v1764926 [Rhizophagus clarus]
MATLLAVEQEDNEISIILQDYIKRKSNQNISERSLVLDERSTIDERSQIEEYETEKERKIIDINLQNIKNLNKVVTKG